MHDKSKSQRNEAGETRVVLVVISSLLESILLSLIEQVSFGATQVHNLRASISLWEREETTSQLFATARKASLVPSKESCLFPGSTPQLYPSF